MHLSTRLRLRQKKRIWRVYFTKTKRLSFCTKNSIVFGSSLDNKSMPPVRTLLVQLYRSSTTYSPSDSMQRAISSLLSSSKPKESFSNDREYNRSGIIFCSSFEEGYVRFFYLTLTIWARNPSWIRRQRNPEKPCLFLPHSIIMWKPTGNLIKLNRKSIFVMLTFSMLRNQRCTVGKQETPRRQFARTYVCSAATDGLNTQCSRYEGSWSSFGLDQSSYCVMQ